MYVQTYGSYNGIIIVRNKRRKFFFFKQNLKANENYYKREFNKFERFLSSGENFFSSFLFFLFSTFISDTEISKSNVRPVSKYFHYSPRLNERRMKNRVRAESLEG